MKETHLLSKRLLNNFVWQFIIEVVPDSPVNILMGNCFYTTLHCTAIIRTAAWSRNRYHETDYNRICFTAAKKQFQVNYEADYNCYLPINFRGILNGWEQIGGTETPWFAPSYKHACINYVQCNWRLEIKQDWKKMHRRCRWLKLPALIFDRLLSSMHMFVVNFLHNKFLKIIMIHKF